MPLPESAARRAVKGGASFCAVYLPLTDRARGYPEGAYSRHGLPDMHGLKSPQRGDLGGRNKAFKRGLPQHTASTCPLVFFKGQLGRLFGPAGQPTLFIFRGGFLPLKING